MLKTSNPIGFPDASMSVDDSWERRRPFPTYATRGMVAAAHPLTVEAGLYILRQGGNAIDAAVAAGLTAAVVMPEMCGLGGDLFAVVHRPGGKGANSGKGEIVSVQGSGISPRGASLEHMRKNGQNGGAQMAYQGPLSISVPGMVDAYFALLSRFGSKQFAEVAQPAVAHARDGFAVMPLGAESLAASAAVLARDPAAAAIFLPGGLPVAAGERLIQTDLAKTLESLGADGVESFYRGKIAQEITTYLNSVGGLLSMDDFADHATAFTDPIATTYRGQTVYQTAIPSQGLILLESLNIIERAEIGVSLTAADIHVMIEAKKLAYADRLAYAADALFHETPIELLLSKLWATGRFAAIDSYSAATDVRGGEFNDGDTTYLSVIDGDGMMVSLIQSVSSSFGSGVVGGDTGVVLNNRVGRGFSLVEGHPNIYAPGKKTMHTLNCFLIADETGQPVLVGGTPGGDGQPQWNMQMISALVDRKLDVQAAIEQPRWTSLPGTDPGSIDAAFTLAIESRMSADIVQELEQLGHAVTRQAGWNGGGSAQLIARNPQTGILIGGTDTRVEGAVLGY